jgi:hypothetical protein
VFVSGDPAENKRVLLSAIAVTATVILHRNKEETILYTIIDSDHKLYDISHASHTNHSVICDQSKIHFDINACRQDSLMYTHHYSPFFANETPSWVN